MKPTSHVFIVAELSANHNHDISLAERTIIAAADAGADAVKLQTYTADTLTIPCKNDYFKVQGTIWEGRTLYDLYQEAFTPWEWHEKLQKVAHDNGMEFFSTPFDSTAVDFLENLNVPCHKVASFEVVDVSLLKKIAQTGKPVIMSTGMATLAEIDEAVTTLRENGTSDLTLLKCTSSYPAPPEEANLLTLSHLAQAFHCKVGLSDHTMGSAVAVAAVALGACVIEKHFCLDRSLGGVDSSFSMEPAEFKQMVSDIRIVEKALGKVNYQRTEKEEVSTAFRRSLFVVEDIKKGELFTEKNIRSIRPGYGLHTRYLPVVLGKTAKEDYAKGTPLSWDMV